MDSKKSMLTFVFNGYGISALDDLPKGIDMNSHYFCHIVLEESRRAVIIITKKTVIRKVMIHLDKYRVFHPDMSISISAK
jgi:hypothetical protein